MKRSWLPTGATPKNHLVNMLDFLSHLSHTKRSIKMGGSMMDSKFLEELRQKYIKNPPEGMTPRLVKNMTDSDLLDMHYFLTEDEDLDEDEFEDGFYIF